MVKMKKAQEEMVGFVVIIVLVTVIALVFLSFSIRKTSEVVDSKEVESFLHSSLLYTSDCEVSSRNYDFRDLIKGCYSKEKCDSEEDICEILKQTADNLISNSFDVGEEKEFKGYDFKIYYGNESFVNLIKGNYTSKTSGSFVLVPIGRESVNMTLRLYS